MSIATTKRDEDIIETLTLKLHLASLEQITAHWWEASTRARQTARERLRKLEVAGLLLRKRVNIHPLLSIDKPVQKWKPGNARPHFGKLAHQLQSRWTEPMALMTVYMATSMAANLFGGFGGRFKHRTQLTHDVHVTAIYFALLKIDSSISKRWCGEELLDIDDGKKPDAMLLNAKGEEIEVIEFGGRYDSRRVEEFHRFCQLRKIGYRLW